MNPHFKCHFKIDATHAELHDADRAAFEKDIRTCLPQPKNL